MSMIRFKDCRGCKHHKKVLWEITIPKEKWELIDSECHYHIRHIYVVEPYWGTKTFPGVIIDYQEWFGDDIKRKELDPFSTSDIEIAFQILELTDKVKEVENLYGNRRLRYENWQKAKTEDEERERASREAHYYMRRVVSSLNILKQLKKKFPEEYSKGIAEYKSGVAYDYSTEEYEAEAYDYEDFMDSYKD